MQKTKQKNAMWVKTEDSTLFEEAYFLLKEKAAPLGDSEMVKEANRIIAAFESKGLPQKKKRERLLSLSNIKVDVLGIQLPARIRIVECY